MKTKVGVWNPLASLKERGIGRVLMAIAILIASLGALGTTLTGAVFSDSESVVSNAFSTGTVDIAASPASAVVSFSTMAPGDKVTASLTVTNDGSLELRYAVTSTSSEDILAGQLDMTIKTGVSVCNNGQFGNDGSVIYGPADLGNSTGANIIGDPAQGADAGDRVLAASATETLCIQIELPLNTGNSYQGLSTDATFAFAAEQTVNN